MNEEFAPRQHRNTQRQRRVAAQQSMTLKKYRQFSLQSSLKLADPMRPAQPLVMSAMQYLEIDETSVRVFHGDA